MKNFKDYEILIRETVKTISKEDPNWNFSVKSISKNRVRIRWTYLDYGEEKDNCFFLKLIEEDDQFNDAFLTARTPQDEMIEGYFVSDNIPLQSWQMSYESGIEIAIREIAYYAHTRY